MAKRPEPKEDTCLDCMERERYQYRRPSHTPLVPFVDETKDEEMGVGGFTFVIILIAIGTFCTIHFALTTAFPWLADLNEIVQAYRSLDGLTLPNN